MGFLKPYKFAESVPLELDAHKHGQWSYDTERRAKVWRAAIRSAGAFTLGISFGEFLLPPGGELYVISANVSRDAVYDDLLAYHWCLHGRIEQQGNEGICDGAAAGRRVSARVLGADA